METSALQERPASLWLLAASPTTWALHFLSSYITAAIWCAKVVPASGSLDPVRAAVAAYTLAALVIIALIGGLGYQWHSAGHAPPPHDADTAEDRQRFLGFAAVLLSGLSAVSVIFTALVVVFIRTCE